MPCRLLTTAVALAIACLLAGCASKPDSAALAAAVVANRELSDAEAIEKLARLEFPFAEAIDVAALDGGEIALTVTIHLCKNAEVKTLKGGPSAAELDSNFVLAMSVMEGRDMVTHGRQRKLARMTLRIRHTVYDASGEKVDVNIFGYTLSRTSFDDYLTTNNAADLIRGKALDTIEKTCVIDFNNFDKLSYTPTNN